MVEYSCEYIDNAISFNRTDFDSMESRVTFCSFMNINNGLGRMPFIEGYKGEPIDWNKLLDERDKLREEFAKGNFPENCKGCPRIEKKPPQTHRKITMLSIAAWQICNSHCIYCEAEYFGKYREYLDDYEKFYKKFVEQYNVYEVVKGMIKQEIIDKNALIDITGGEPTLYPRFNDMLDALIEYGCNNIRVLTNTIIYSPIIEKALRKDAVTLTISLDAGTKKVHEKVKGVCSYDLIWENIRKYSSVLPKNSNHQIDLKYIIVEGLNDTKKEVETWIKLSKKNGATCVSVNATNQLLEKVNIDKKTSDKIMNLADFAYKKAKKIGIPIYFHANLLDVYDKFNRKPPVRMETNY
jgi:wyosine [tRNA(Phe)-imidazoG37] synthetase (radical SAM superfamily)